ncbi:hypothetical protein [Streptomyces mutabilis]|uniref:hypothetical protein n=1 Tax=Streptomyces mutabilis TaxID=67332 RepID=UPI000694FBDA|nr:hypothetical protein [Streptomyces mutabilis]
MPAAARRARAQRPARTTTVVYDCVHLRVRASGASVLWFVRDAAAALGFRLPLTPGGAAPQVAVTTEESHSVMAAAGFRSPAAITARAAQVPHRPPHSGPAPVPRR